MVRQMEDTENPGHERKTLSPTDDINATQPPKTRAAHQRLVLTDPVAFRYLEEDPSITVLERRRRLQGYELYIVEQWICSRVHPTFVITTYTGLEQHSVLVGVISIPTDEDEWSPRLRVWFKALGKYHARKKETPLGTLMVTNLSGFPSALTVIPVPDGDVKAHREDFIVNENMKRMGCSGRAGMNLTSPTGATQAKFTQLYQTSDRITFYGAVMELVKLCQVALVLYGKLAAEYADGLICDVTEQAINDWWNDLGTEYFNVDPTDGILGPTTVAALLGILMGARNRLHAYGAPVAKDVFETASTKRAIAYFQKSQKLPRTRRLDLQTLKKLRNVTAKAASGEGWAVPRAVKTTVAELSGKGGDMVMGRVGAREKAGIADIETLDIEIFISLLSGERSKWLWYGKPRKTNDSEGLGNVGSEDGMVFTKDDKGGYMWSSQKRESVIDDPRGISSRIYSHQSHDSQTSLDTPEKEQNLRRNVFKGVHGKMTDARSGFGWIKDAVGISGFRGHHHKYSKDEPFLSDGDTFKERPPQRDDELSNIYDKKLASSQTKTTLIRDSDESKEGSVASIPINALPRETTDPKRSSRDSSGRTEAQDEDVVSLESAESGEIFPPDEEGVGSPRRTADNMLALDFDTKNMGYLNLFKGIPNGLQNSQESAGEQHFPAILRRTRSSSKVRTQDASYTYGDRWPRHLSFSTFLDVASAEPTNDWATSANLDAIQSPSRALAREEGLAVQAQKMAKSLQLLKDTESLIVESKVNEVIELDKQGGRDQETLDYIHHEKLEEFNHLRDASDDLLTEERNDLTESVKDIKDLAEKLEYELDNLQSKVEDVEDGVAEYERQVLQLEARAQELEKGKEESWLRWYLGFLMGKTDA